MFPIFTIRDLHGTGLTYPLLFAVVSLGALAGALGTARRRSISVRSVALSAVGYGSKHD